MSEDINYNKSNQLKVHWHETDVYEFEGDNNKGFVYGIVEWWGDRPIGEAIDNDSDNISNWEIDEDYEILKINFSNEIEIVFGNIWDAGNLSYHLKSRPKCIIIRGKKYVEVATDMESILFKQIY